MGALPDPQGSPRPLCGVTQRLYTNFLSPCVKVEIIVASATEEAFLNDE